MFIIIIRIYLTLLGDLNMVIRSVSHVFGPKVGLLPKVRTSTSLNMFLIMSSFHTTNLLKLRYAGLSVNLAKLEHRKGVPRLRCHHRMETGS